ncbi:hypothetical protein PYCC9005_004055 [Savitreella phatthalungensis]
MAAADVVVESMVFLGTGTSSQVPVIGCLTKPGSRCLVCPSSLSSDLPGRRNRRRNTSAVLSLSNGRTVLVDCGKSFFEAALQLWPRAGLRRIDALLLTHAHADAVLGLDDLRGWTLGRFVQDTVDIYCSQATFVEVERMFPYLIDRSRATGGGDVPQFDWHVLPDEGGEFEAAGGVTFTQVPVRHGWRGVDEDGERIPLMCDGFRVGGFTYVSDCSGVPARAAELMQGTKVLVLDGLKHDPHASHFSIGQALDYVVSTHGQKTSGDSGDGVPLTYLLDFTHEVDHASLVDELDDWSKTTSKQFGRHVEARASYDGLQLKFDWDAPADRLVKEEVDLFALPLRAASDVAAEQGSAPAPRDGKTKSMV